MDEFQRQLDNLLDQLQVSRSTTKGSLWIEAHATHDEEGVYEAYFALVDSGNKDDEDRWSVDANWLKKDAVFILESQLPARWKSIDQGMDDMGQIWQLLINMKALEIIQQNQDALWVQRRLTDLYGNKLELLDKEEARDFVTLLAIGEGNWRKPTTLQTKMISLKSPHDWKLINFITEKMIGRGGQG